MISTLFINLTFIYIDFPYSCKYTSKSSAADVWESVNTSYDIPRFVISTASGSKTLKLLEKSSDWTIQKNKLASDQSETRPQILRQPRYYNGRGSSSGAGGRGFDPRSGHTKDFKLVVMAALLALWVAGLHVALRLTGWCQNK